MSAISRIADPNAVEGASSDTATNATPMPRTEQGRWFSLRGGERGKQFALRLKANTSWIMRFLHGGL